MNPFVPLLSHSTKDIPVAKQTEVKELLTEAVAKFIRNFLWDAFFKLSENKNQTEKKQTFGLPSNRAPPTINKENYGENFMDIKHFVSRIYRIVRITKFKKYTNEYQEELKKTLAEIKECKDLIIKADKTKNFYKVPREDYQKMLQDAISQEYKKTDSDLLDEVNVEAVRIASSLGLGKRMEMYHQNEAFCTLNY